MRGNVFNTPQKIREMLEFRSNGLSYKRLASKYRVDHTSIIYWCQKYNIKKCLPLPEFTVKVKKKVKYAKTHPKIIIAPNPKDKYAYIWAEKVSSGKPYKDYLKQDMSNKR